jgi:hypothetical protein
MNFLILATAENFSVCYRVLGNLGRINYPFRRLLEGSFRGGEVAGAEPYCCHVVSKVKAMELYIRSFMPWCLITILQYTRVYNFHIDLIEGFRNYPMIQEPPPNSRLQKGDVKQVSHQAPKVLKWPMNHTVLWCILLGACELLHMYVSM